MPRNERRPYVQVAVLRSADTGLPVAVSLMWVTTIRDTDSGAVFTFLDGSAVTVEESFADVMDGFGASVSGRKSEYDRGR